MDRLSTRAVSAAATAARKLGLKCSDEPEVLADGANVMVRLAPAPEVARVATTTGRVRKPVREWLALDLEMASFLAGRGFPVVKPSGELPPGPHEEDGLTLSFWEFVEHDRQNLASAQEAGALLRELHAELRGFQSSVKHAPSYTEIPRWLDQLEAWKAIDPADLAMLRRGYGVELARMEALHLPEQPLHGDAHRKNLLRTSRGLLWTDFEDACAGPIAWDVACFVRTAGEDTAAALARYGEEMAPAALEPFHAVRDLQGAVWMAILTTRFADRKERSAEWMAMCRARYA